MRHEARGIVAEPPAAACAPLVRAARVMERIARPAEGGARPTEFCFAKFNEE
jgi:hypothetical protein